MKVGLVQMDSQDRISENVSECARLIREGARRRVDLVAFPEHCLYLGKDRSIGLDESGPEIAQIRQAARRSRVSVLIGSYRERIPGDRRVHNTSLLIDSRGMVCARYGKIHLFESHFRKGPRLVEAKTVKPGRRIVVAPIKTGKGRIQLGLSICYDLRFPELYRRLTLSGAQVLCVPSNFNRFTGVAHWFPLLRARAIENQAFVVAPAQIGTKPDGWVAFGHAVAIDPWGTVVFDAGKKEGVFRVDLDLRSQIRLRHDLPALRNVRLL